MRLAVDDMDGAGLSMSERGAVTVTPSVNGCHRPDRGYLATLIVLFTVR
jgi:hypothetical protein